MPETTQRGRLAAAIDAVLPQTQCGQCGYSACRPYAEALAAGQAAVNRCPPGGDEGAAEIARLIGANPQPVDPKFGRHEPPQVARIAEADCIGCTLCITACPVDAIVGAPRLMHTVIAAECTGCRLCVAPCPVDCIAILPSGEQDSRSRTLRLAERALRRYMARAARLARRSARRSGPGRTRTEHKRSTVERAIARARERLKTGKT